MAWSINDAGQVAGDLVQGVNSPRRPFRWTPSETGSAGTLELLATPELSEEAAAYAIDSAGRCAGIMEPVGEVFTRNLGQLWPTPGSSVGIALQRPLAINDHGQIVGGGPSTPAGHWHAGLWQPEAAGATTGATHQLSLPPGATLGEASAINASGQVAGTAWDFPPLVTPFGSFEVGRRAFLWTPASANGTSGSAISLGTLSDSLFPGRMNYSEALGINRRGVVVGTSNNRAFIYRRGMMEDLNDFILTTSGWELVSARAINDRGWIVGMGIKDGQYFHGYVLRPSFPLDEPLKPARSRWATWWQHGDLPIPPPEPAGPAASRPARESLADLLAQPLSPQIWDVMVSLAASDLAASLQDGHGRAAIQTAALKAAARAIQRLLGELRDRERSGE